MNRSLLLTFALFMLFVPQPQAQTPAPAPSGNQSASTPFLAPEAARPGEITVPDDGPKEDWTTLSLAKSNLPLTADGGFLLNTIEMSGGCTRELQRFEWRRGDPIDLYVIHPPRPGATDAKQKLPVVLFLYNYTYDTDLFRQDRWCDLVKRNGYVAAGFASALSWQRFHSPRPMNQWFVSQLQEALSTSTHDVQMVINYLQSRGDIDAHTIAMFGQGSGGAIAILAAAADPRIKALDVMDPWGDWPDWLKGSQQIPDEERPLYLKPEFLQSVHSLDPVTYLPQLAGRSLRIQQITTDPVTPADARRKIAASVPKSEITQYPDLATESKELGTNGIVGWLGEQIRHQDSPGSTHAQLKQGPGSDQP